MPLLKCGVNSCIYFYNERCSRSVIKVMGETATREKDTNCSSFSEVKRQAEDDYNLEIATIDDIISDYLSVNCDATNCIYNRNELCHAKDIKIDGTRARNYKETFCSSFTKK